MTGMVLEVTIQEATDYDDVRQLWAQYWDEHHEDLGAQDLAAEGQDLPGPYKDGAILVARAGDEVLGTVAFRPFDAETADMKRMYVPKEHRGSGIGSRLCLAVIEAARAKGFKRMVLDTTESMTAARSVYRKHGFVDADGYAHSPCHGPVYMIRDL